MVFTLKNEISSEAINEWPDRLIGCLLYQIALYEAASSFSMFDSGMITLCSPFPVSTP